MERYTINDFNRQFPNDDACLEWLRGYLYPNGITCKSCGKITGHSKLSNLPVYSCNMCGAHTHPMVGTIFEHSRTSLKQWFYAMFLISATRCGISAKQLQRELGVTYKTAWRIFHQVRSLMQDTIEPVCGEIEIDETYVGGRKHGGKGGRSWTENKTPVLGIAKRGGTVSARIIPNAKANTLIPIIKESVLSYSLVYTDEFVSYDQLKHNRYFHHKVNHAKKEWAKGGIHTNTIEGFWSTLKRGISGVYHSVSRQHLQRYIDEYSFRYNHRKDEQPMFLTILGKV
jgi:transposase